MRSTSGNLTCTICGHQVNPRSERCDVDHSLCSASGCRSKISYWPTGPVVTAAQARARARALLSATPSRLVDLASYQEGISLPAVLAAGFTAVNIKLTQGNWYRWTNGKAYADSARNLGMGLCTFSWIDNSASGATQAAYAYQQMQAIGGPDGVAHQCDCEDSARPASWQTWVDYIHWWQDKLGRDVANYTGDWWWPSHMGNRGAEVCKYLWAGPNAGYLSSYPGDTSSAWHAGYGGWTDYSLLQYAVQAVSGAGGGNLSKTAIRDPNVWAVLTGKKVMDVALADDPDGKWMFPRVEAMAKLQKPSGGPEKGTDLPFVLWTKLVMAQLEELSSRAPGEFTDAQVDVLAERIAASPAIVEAVKQALREGAGA
jgi:hypothetical protein